MEPITSSPPAGRLLLDAQGRPYEPAVSPRLKVLLVLIFAGVAFLGASGAYLLAVRLIELTRVGPGGFVPVTNYFTLWMFSLHEWLGVLGVLPFVFFGLCHMIAARHRQNRVAVKLGIALFVSGLVVVITGIALIQIPGFPQLPTETWSRRTIFWLHSIVPLLAVVLYIQHRRAGPAIQWKWGYAWGGSVALFILAMLYLHSQDPRRWYAQGSPDGEKYFEPSKARTMDGNFISAQALLMDEYCLRCHQDIYNDHLHSAHKFSSFNNPAYLFSVLETRRVGNQRDGNPRSSRWCAGCHDPVPFFSGAFDEPVFDDPKFDVSQHATAGAGITCTVCHAIVNVNSRMGNADFTIEEPLHYPLAYSKNPVLQWLNNQVVKARPEFHKQTFLKPFHRSEEFCSTCHKVSLPLELNHYKEFLRGQNHSDTFLLSGVSGHGARSFYYPPEAKTRCAECHMPLKPSLDFGSRDFDNSGVRKVHNHLFVGANTGLPTLVNYEERDRVIQAHTDFLRGTDPEGKDKKLRIDLFGLKKGGSIDGPLLAPLRPQLPKLEPGQSYLVEVVVRTVGMGHPFSQGTVDSNEIWVDFTARSGQRIIGRNGGLDGPDDSGRVDDWSHFINVLMLDRHGNRIDRRNPQDIFTPLYNHQIPPGAAQVVHYKLDVPPDVKEAVNLKVRLRYRKFDYAYMEYVHKAAKLPVPRLPIVDICEDELTLPVAGVAEQVPEQASPIKPPWQRWNDYGIGCLIEGGVGMKRGELRQAREAFEKLLKLEDKEPRAHGHLNLARVALDEGRLADAVESLNQAKAAGAPWWTVAWFSGLVNAQNGHLDRATDNFEQILDPQNQPRDRKFDFTKDYVVINELASTLFKRAQQEDDKTHRDRFLLRAVAKYRKTLAIDSEDVDAHYGLWQCFALLSDQESARGGGGAKDEPDSTALLALADRLSEGGVTQRLEAARTLAGDLRRYGELSPRPGRPRLATFQTLTRRCQGALDGAGSPELRAAIAGVLAIIHQNLHAIFKPDENAQEVTVRKYRDKHPAANHAAEAIVIYPTNRFDRR